MRSDWEDPHMLEPRPNHRATEAEQEDFMEAMNELGLIASHLGATVEINASFRPSRKRKQRVSQEKPTNG